MRAFAINPGSTSTKVALFDGEKCVFSKTVRHSSEELAQFSTLAEQLPFRAQAISDILAEEGVDLAGVEAFVGRGGGLLPMEGGVYEVTDLILEHSIGGANGVTHPANLGPTLARRFAETNGGRAFVVNPPDTDELCGPARMTGVKGVYRHVHLHALNLKETAIRHAATLGRSYEDCDFVVCHIGGGISISAHNHGRMIDGNDIVGGEGPMAPTRAGAVPVVEVLDYLEAGHSVAETRRLCMKTGGFESLVGTSDAMEIIKRADAGDAGAKCAWDAMVYQVCKEIGAMAAVLGGHVDGILLGGGLVFEPRLVDAIRERCGWIAPVTAYPGEFEMEAMAAGALRVLNGEEELKTYTGVPIFAGFSD
ncbi:MAG: butyrate kinase [Atopobiaceae bacterium]